MFQTVRSSLFVQSPSSYLGESLRGLPYLNTVHWLCLRWLFETYPMDVWNIHPVMRCDGSSSINCQWTSVWWEFNLNIPPGVRGGARWKPPLPHHVVGSHPQTQTHTERSTTGQQTHNQKSWEKTHNVYQKGSATDTVQRSSLPMKPFNIYLYLRNPLRFAPSPPFSSSLLLDCSKIVFAAIIILFPQWPFWSRIYSI